MFSGHSSITKDKPLYRAPVTKGSVYPLGLEPQATPFTIRETIIRNSDQKW